jgi:hypothetical protein
LVTLLGSLKYHMSLIPTLQHSILNYYKF